MIFFRSDTEKELQLVKEACLENGADAAVVCDHWSLGGSGALDLADAVISACKEPTNFR